MDANQALMHLRLTLSARGMDAYTVDSICDQASTEINQAIFSAVRSAMAEAEAAGIDKKSLPFLSELTATSFGSNFRITTDSGKTDFSEPPFPMLYKLLKNAKVSKKDGKLYKVIPIKKKVGLSSDSYLKNRADEIQMYKDTFNDNVKNLGSSPDPTSSAKDYIDSFKSGRPDKNKPQRRSIDTPTEGFRTVTNLQDPQTQWVRPSKEADFTMTLADINARLSSTIDDIVSSTISKYGG